MIHLRQSLISGAGANDFSQKNRVANGRWPVHLKGVPVKPGASPATA